MMMPIHRQKIVVGIVFNQLLDSVLIARRPKDKIKGGYWEFPGGKPEPGESELDALSREVLEETGIEVIKARPVQEIDYNYSHASIALSVWIVDDWNGEICGREGQQVKWCDIEDLSLLKFPEANEKLIKLLNLPALYLITPDLPGYDEKFFTAFSVYLDSGLKLVQFRSTSLKQNDRLILAEKLIKQCEKYNCRLIFNGSIEEARKIGAHGVHLNSKRLMQGVHHDTKDDFYVAGSCHNLSELEMAEKCNLDFSVLSPVRHTLSHSESDILGWKKISVLTSKVNVPVYALGGLKFDDLDNAFMSGCYGISMISGIWNSKNGKEIVRLLGNRPGVRIRQA